jgi:signal transduction histidine kinase
LHFTGARQLDCWVEVIITPVYTERNEIDELLVMGTNITHRKAAEQNMNKKNRSEIEKKINQQKFRSVLILEGQEEERKRIAMDIHDGIGQMLTSLKFQIESIDPAEGGHAEQKIAEVGQLIKQIIKEVRRVTFNLKPTVLGDYGLQAALNVFTQEIGKLTDIRLIYKTEGEVERLPQKIENNIFRIIQEAINNAIKYSEADAIEVRLAQEGDDLIIEVKDRGKGFDTKIVEARSVNIESGRGFFNMYERTEYINGHLSINAEPGKGTKVVLRVPVRSAVMAD